jgi:predicted nucleotidyltransferase
MLRTAAANDRSPHSESPPDDLVLGVVTPVKNPVDTLESRLGATWGAIRQARTKTDELRAKLTSALAGLDDPNCAVVVTGSLGRGEASEDSDADWVLLVDGPSNPDHARMARAIGERIFEVLPKKVGPTGTFGTIVASHELVHHIAGTRDTNENLTRRILLLAESRALTSPSVRERVIRNLLARYAVHDRSVPNKTGRYNRIPHFLLNDVVRYWRTMASDYASKMWERDGKGWGIRNIKLRFSRKLLLVWGFLASFSGELFSSEPLDKAEQEKDEDDFLTLLSELIGEQAEVTPLDLLARVAAHEGVEAATARAIFDAYDEFLTALSDPATRKSLEAVPFAEAATDPSYDRLRCISAQYRDGINAMFFDQHPKLKRLIRQYGVF